jgi:hypothetical protein
VRCFQGWVARSGQMHCPGANSFLYRSNISGVGWQPNKNHPSWPPRPDCPEYLGMASLVRVMLTLFLASWQYLVFVNIPHKSVYVPLMFPRKPKKRIGDQMFSCRDIRCFPLVPMENGCSEYFPFLGIIHLLLLRMLWGKVSG